MASPHSRSFPHSPLDLSVAGPVVTRNTGGITIQWPSVTERSVDWIVASRMQTRTNAMTNRNMSTITIWSFFTELETDVCVH